MGLIGTTFRIASKVNDKVPFTPQTRTVYETTSKLDIFNLLPDFPKEEEVEEEAEAEESDDSKTLMNGIGSVGSGNIEKQSKIKEKLILSRRIKIAINEGDEDFNVENILRHDDTLVKEDTLLPPYHVERHSPVFDSRNFMAEFSDYDVSDNDINSRDQFGNTLEDALSCLHKALTNDRIKSDDDLFDRFFSSSLLQIVNTVFRNKHGFQFDEVLQSLDRHLKFYILRTYLNDDQLVRDFKSNFHHKHSNINQTFSSTPVKNSRQNSPLTTPRKIVKPQRHDLISMKTIQLFISVSYKSLMFLMSILLPLLQLIWLNFLELNEQYHVINRVSDLIVYLFALFIDQILIFIDNGETFESTPQPQKNPKKAQKTQGFPSGSNRTYLRMLKTLVVEKLSTKALDDD